MTSFVHAIRPRDRSPAQLAFATVKAGLLPLVRARRRRLRQTVFVGVTGSAGKTTTKGLIAHVLGRIGAVAVASGSGNRSLALAQTILGRTRRSTAFCVQELAAWGPDTLDELLWTFEPDVGVVTSVGHDHHAMFRRLEAVAAEKGKLVEALPSHGLAVLNGDDPLVRAMASRARARVVLVGSDAACEVRAERVACAWPEPLALDVVVRGERVRVRTRLLGDVWVPSVLAAVAVAREYGLSLAAVASALAECAPEPHRLEATTTPDGVTFLQDNWKAPAWSVPFALDVMRNANAARRIVVLGQLSDDSRRPRDLYARLIEQAADFADLVVVVGRWASSVSPRARGDGPRVAAFERVAEVAEFFRETLREGDLVLLKGTLTTDHSERLVLDRSTPVRCWRDACGRAMFCEHCRKLGRPGRSRAPGSA